MPTGSGLDSQLGTKTESAVGTLAVPVTQFFPFNNADLTPNPSYIENNGIMAGARFKDANQVGIARKAASGQITVPVMMNGFGWWLKHILGSTADPVLDGTLAYKQIHTPGGLRGVSFTTQIGKPDPRTGTVAPRTYRGCKVTDWTLTFNDNAVTTLDMSVDAWDQDTATTLAAATYPAGNKAFNFAHVTTFTTGGTASTTAGLTTISGGIAVPSVVTKLALSGKATLAADRYGLGNAGVKKEQLETDFFVITGAFEGEFDADTWETPLEDGDIIPIQVDSVGPDIESGKPYLLSIIMPACIVTKAPAPVSGPDIVKVSGEFTVYDPKLTDGTPPIQVVIESTDSAAW